MKKNQLNPPVNVRVHGDGNDISLNFMNEQKLIKFCHHVKKNLPGTVTTFTELKDKIIT